MQARSRRGATLVASSVLVLSLLLGGQGVLANPWSLRREPSRFVTAPWAQAMKETVETLGRRFPGRFGIVVSDVDRGFRYGHNEDRAFYLASAVKLAFMIEVFRQRERGHLRFEDTLTYGPEDIRDGSPRLHDVAEGSKVTIAELLDLMIRSSDNAASDLLSRHVGLENIERGLRDEGLKGFSRLTYMIDVRRGVYRGVDVRADDFTPFEVRALRWTPVWEPQVAKLNETLGVPEGTYTKADLLLGYDRFFATGVNRAPLRSIGRLFERMLTGKLVSRKASLEMLELLTGARTSTARILGRLPPGTLVAHKTGSQWQHLCDMGVIQLPDKSPLIVAACAEKGEPDPSERLVARLARRAYDLASQDHAKTSPHH
ncbi:MAG: serine hydrolase [Deltaproteobacteria bacterium]|nr:serine hydrolase [Deltaproteobacteria bacterium]